MRIDDEGGVRNFVGLRIRCLASFSSYAASMISQLNTEKFHGEEHVTEFDDSHFDLEGHFESNSSEGHKSYQDRLAIPRVKTSVRFEVLVGVGVQPLGGTKPSCRRNPALRSLLCLCCGQAPVACFDASLSILDGTRRRRAHFDITSSLLSSSSFP